MDKFTGLFWVINGNYYTLCLFWGFHGTKLWWYTLLSSSLLHWSTINYSTWPSAVLQGVVGNSLLSLTGKNQSPSKFNQLLLLCKHIWISWSWATSRRDSTCVRKHGMLRFRNWKCNQPYTLEIHSNATMRHSTLGNFENLQNREIAEQTNSNWILHLLKNGLFKKWSGYTITKEQLPCTVNAWISSSGDCIPRHFFHK